MSWVRAEGLGGGAPTDGGPTDDEANLAAVLAVLVALRADRGTGVEPRRSGRCGGEALARWRTRRLAALGPPR